MTRQINATTGQRSTLQSIPSAGARKQEAQKLFARGHSARRVITPDDAGCLTVAQHSIAVTVARVGLADIVGLRT
jgi:hypothetical protein